MNHYALTNLSQSKINDFQREKANDRRAKIAQQGRPNRKFSPLRVVAILTNALR